MNQNKTALIIGCTILFSLSCSLLGGSSDTGTALQRLPTRTPQPTFTPMPVFSELAVIPTSTPEPPTSTPAAAPEEPPVPVDTPTSPPTNTPVPAPKASVSQVVNIREGPGTNYRRVGQVTAGHSSDVLGRNDDASWIVINYSGGQGWIYAPLTQINGEINTVPERQTSAQPVAQQPSPAQPPQTQANNPPPSNPNPATSACEQQYAFCPDAWFSDHNPGFVHFRGVIKNTSGGGVNGFSVRVSNGGFSVLSFPSGPSSAAPDWHDGKWDIALTDPPVQKYFGGWTLQVVRYECSNFFDSQCNQYTPLSEAVPITIEDGDEVIVADWICNRECNTGTIR